MCGVIFVLGLIFFIFCLVCMAAEAILGEVGITLVLFTCIFGLLYLLVSHGRRK